MKKILWLLVFLLCVSYVSAANWYVDNVASSGGNGQSWNTAWKLFADIEWNSIQPGDTVYLSGGVNQKVYGDERTIIGNKPYEYSLRIRASGEEGNPITITKGIDSGHNGDVIFDSDAPATGGAAIYVQSNHHITISGFRIQNFTKGISLYTRSVNAINNIIIENNDIEAADHAGVFSDGYANKKYIQDVTIRNNKFTTKRDIPKQTDLIYMQYATNTRIYNNYGVMSNINGCGACHNDWVHLEHMDNTYIYNNYLKTDNNKRSDSSGLIFRALYGETLIYNNKLLHNYGNCNKRIGLVTPEIADGSLEIYNNVLAGQGIQFIITPTPETTTIRNNIFYRFGEADCGGTFITASLEDGVIITNNLFYDETTPNRRILFGNTNSELDPSNIFIVDPEFVDFYSDDFRLQATSLGIDTGYDLSDKFNFDFDGVSRPQGAVWDIGAYEFGGSVSFHPADLNQNGCVDIGEIVAYVDLWKDGLVTIQQVVAGVEAWQQGCP